MAPAFLSSMSSKTLQQLSTNQEDSSRDCSNEKAHVMHTHTGIQQQEWAPSQVIRLQRIERQERESLRNSEIGTAKDIVSLDDANNNNSDNDNHDNTEIGVSLERQTQDFDEDEIFHLSPSTCPNMRDDPEPVDLCHSTLPSATHQLKIFTGSWNMAAKDPFADKKGQYVGDVEAATSLSDFLPLGYDLYVVGTQEKVSNHLHKAVLARLNTTSPETHACNTNTTSYARLPLRSLSRAPIKSASLALSPIQTSVRAQANNSSEFSESFVDSMLQTSSFGLRDSSTSIGSSTETGSSSSSIFSAAASELVRASSSQSKKRSRRSRGHEVRGRGDGAFLRSKSTSIAIYVAAHLTSIIEVVRTGAHKFAFTSGSKGGLGVMLRVAGDQTITFVNCHLEANRPARRHQQLDILTRKLPKAMGMDSSKLDLAACSDHVVWMGDFNYRVHSLDGDTVLKLLGTHRHMELHDRYDSMKEDMETVPGMRPFKEATKWPSFYPTYKKVPHRSPLVSTEDPSWPLHVYRVRYKEPFYKGGKVKARVPGWCDRILHCSSPAWRTYLNVEKLPCTMASSSKEERHCADTESNKDSRILLRENYRSVNDALRGSDHSPVFCTFLLSVDLSPGRVLR